MSTPSDRRYTKSHEWILLKGDTALVGITDHAQHALGDITFVELPKLPRTVAAGESCCVVESVKAASDIYAPVAGEIAAVNEDLANQPELLNASPYDKAWIFKMKGVSKAEVDALLDAAAYEKTLG